MDICRSALYRISGAIALCLIVPLNCFADQFARESPAIQKTIAAVDADGLQALKTDLDHQCLAAVQSPRVSNVPMVLTMSACREFAKYFGTIDHLTAVQKETLSWLAAQPHLMPTLMSAVSSKDAPDKVIDTLNLLRSEDPERLDEYPDLATAMIVVWDKPLAADATRHADKFDRNRPVLLFDYFTNPQNRMRFDLRSLAWQLAVYIVDLRVSPEEMQWAASRYYNNYSIADLYFEVTYDDRAFLNGDDKKITGHPYTLQNLLQYGGVCVEQAYFSEQVAKTLGIPACMCTSRGGGSGAVSHAWLGLLTFLNGRTAWDFDQGRYKEDLYWSADIIDPQTHETLTDADVGLLAELQNVPPAVRQTSALELKLADLLPPSGRVDLYLREIQNSPGNRSAWSALADLGAKHMLTSAQTSTYERDIDNIILRPFPDFACQSMMHFVSGMPMTDQVNSLDRIAMQFPGRPDLKARIRLVQADLLIAKSQNDIAMRALTDVLTNDLNAGPIVMQALQRVEKLMRAQNDLPDLAGIYANLWPKLPAPDRSAYVYTTPYYLIGKKYMKLLQTLGRQNDADAVGERLTEIIPPGAPLQ